MTAIIVLALLVIAVIVTGVVAVTRAEKRYRKALADYYERMGARNDERNN